MSFYFEIVFLNQKARLNPTAIFEPSNSSFFFGIKPPETKSSRRFFDKARLINNSVNVPFSNIFLCFLTG